LSIKVDGLAGAIGKELKVYGESVTEGVKKASDIVAAELLENTKRDAKASGMGGTGKYIRAMAVKTTKDDAFGRVNTWYVKKPHYRLAHLLEHGHVLRSGGRTRAYPHIKKNEEQAMRYYTGLVEGVIRRG
jgi:hypothetical protein